MFLLYIVLYFGFPWWLSVKKNLPASEGEVVQCLGLEDPLEKEMPTPVFLPWKSHGQRILAGCSPWGCKRVGCDLETEQQQILVF